LSDDDADGDDTAHDELGDEDEQDAQDAEEEDGVRAGVCIFAWCVLGSPPCAFADCARCHKVYLRAHGQTHTVTREDLQTWLSKIQVRVRSLFVCPSVSLWRNATRALLPVLLFSLFRIMTLSFICSLAQSIRTLRVVVAAFRDVCGTDPDAEQPRRRRFVAYSGAGESLLLSQAAYDICLPSSALCLALLLCALWLTRACSAQRAGAADTGHRGCRAAPPTRPREHVCVCMYVCVC
jgi:hypothetical protein